MSVLKKKIRELVFAPQKAERLAGLRIGVAFVLLLQAFLISFDFANLYTGEGYLQSELNAFIVQQRVPTFPEWWTILHILPFDESSTIWGVFALYTVSLVALMLGWQTRAAAFVAWLAHLVLMYHQGYLGAYGVDSFANIFLFYLILIPSNEVWSLDSSRQMTAWTTSYWRGPAVRVLQFHLFVIYSSSGILKAEGVQWRNGEVIWRSVNLPQFAVFDMSWMAGFPELAMALSWSVLFLEIFYPVLMSFRKTRLPCVLGIVGVHLGIAVMLGLWTFSLFMIVLTVSLFYLPCRGLSASDRGEVSSFPAERSC